MRDDRREHASLWASLWRRFDCLYAARTSQVPVSRWHELMGDPMIGDAILDRVVHRAHRIELKGPSLRKRHAVSVPAEGGGQAAPT